MTETTTTTGMEIPPPAPDDAAADPRRADPERLRSDLDTIKEVLRRGRSANEPHRMLVAAGNLVFAGFFLIGAGIVLVVFSVPMFAGAGRDGFVPLFVGFFVALLLALFAIPSALAGWGLLKGKSWAAAATVVAAVINAFNIPIGTAFAVYTIWAVVKGKLEPQ
jgi:hypothetical protein